MTADEVAKMDRISVLFVDDDVNILSGLKRSMRACADRCDSRFCTSGEEALVLLAQSPADVVVSDMRMPCMDGAAFLTHVQSLYPATVRIILSGYAAPESVLRTIEPAHLYLAKPCSPEVLINAVTRPLALRQILRPLALRQILAGLSTVPTLPQMFHSLEAELRSANVSAAAVAKIIASDVAMTAELMKLTNSAYFSVSGRVTTPLQAVRLLGLETVHALVLQIGIFRQFAQSGRAADKMWAITTYSIRLGRLVQDLAKSDGGAASLDGLAYCAGLLSSIGAIVLLDAYPRRMIAVQDRVLAGATLAAAEDAEFGANHWLIGAYLLGLWGFAEPVVEAIAFALTPSICGGYDNALLAALHAGVVLGPRSPLLPEVRQLGATAPANLRGNGCIMDMAYMVEARKDGHLAEWRQIADTLHAEWTGGVTGHE